jgi:uncharacterized protein
MLSAYQFIILTLMANNSNRGGNRNGGRGFASMDSDRQREIASMGGKAAHAKGTANEFDSESGARAGRKGGKASHSSRGGRGGNRGGNNNRGSDRGGDRSESIFDFD